MKQSLFILLFLSAITLLSCRKNRNEQDIKQFDQSQILNYISANGLTGMKPAGDTTGIYYQVLQQGTGKALDYPDTLSYVFTIKSFDNKFIQSDTIANHFFGYLGHVNPNGLMLGIHNLLKNKGSSVRLLIPSHLAFGVNGTGSGSKTITTGRIAGNQCLDYYIHVIDRQDLYDDLVIRNYMKANNLTGYIKADSGYYYKVITPGNGVNPIQYYSTITTTYTGQFLNGTYFDQTYQTTSTTLQVNGLVSGVKDALERYATGGTSISILVPSRLGYGQAGVSGSIPGGACLRFEFQITGVAN